MPDPLLFSVSIRGFQAWLDSRGSSFSTQATYCGRIRGLLKALDVPTEQPSLRISALDAARVHSYVASLKPATAALTAAAWKSFCAYVEAAGGERLPPLPTKRSTVLAASSAPAEPLLRPPEEIEVVAWALFGARGVPAPVLGALRWGHVTWVAGMSALDSTGVELPNYASPGGAGWRWFDLAPWRVLWQWSLGDRPAVLPGDALLARARGSSDALLMEQVQHIYLEGARGLMPAYIPAPWSAPSAPPPLPPSLREPTSAPSYPPGFVPPVGGSDDPGEW